MTSADVFIPASRLEERIHAGDAGGVVQALRALQPDQRKPLCAGIRKIARLLDAGRWDTSGKGAHWWGAKIELEHVQAASAALFVCGTDQDRAEHWLWDGSLFASLDLLESASLERLAGDLIRSNPRAIDAVQRLIAGGMSVRPSCDEYIVGLIGVPQTSRNGKSPVLAMLDEDPGLLDGPLLRVFEVEGTGDINMSSIEKYNHRPENTWNYVFLELIGRGVYSRVQLLEKTIGTLECDWPQFRAGWFSRFHAVLAPTPDEMAPLAARYLGLCQSRIPPTVTLALSVLAVLLKEQRIAGEAVLDALAPVMSSPVKGQVESGLKLIGQLVKQKAVDGHVASALAQRGLAHESPELQKKIIGRLSAWGVSEHTRHALGEMLAYVSASNRDELSALIGTALPEPAGEVALAAQAGPAGLLSPLDPGRRLPALDDIGELVQAIAFVFENEQETDEFERVIDALARRAPLCADARQRLAPVLKRAVKLLETRSRDERPLALAVARLLVYLVAGEKPAGGSKGNSARGQLNARVDDLMEFARQATSLPALCTPTHRRGFIAPLALVERVAAHAVAGARSTLEEQVRALLRLAPGATEQARLAARALPASEFVQALRYALGDEVAIGSERALFVAAARIRHPDQDDSLMIARYGVLGPDGPNAARYDWSVETTISPEYTYRIGDMAVEPKARECDPAFIAMQRHEEYWDGGQGILLYGASVLPSSLEAFFASGAKEIGNNIDWWEARWQDKAYLQLLLDRATPVTPMACMTLAFALGGKEPGQTAMAVDAFVACVLEGRLDGARVAPEVRKLILSGLGKAARYAKSLAGAARAHAAMPRAVFDLLCGVLEIGAVEPPKDTGNLLELMLELSLRYSLPLPDATCATIGRFKLAGKGRAAQKELLARPTTAA